MIYYFLDDYQNETEIDVFQIDMDQHLGIIPKVEEEEGYLRINDFNADDGGDDGDDDGGDEDFQPIDDNFE